MGRQVLCVAEKPSIAKSISGILSKGASQTRNGRNKYCKNFDFNYRLGNETVTVVVTSVLGHLMELDFTDANTRRWQSCSPNTLFDAAISTIIPDSAKTLQTNLEVEARKSYELIIWTDCDREGECIGAEIADVCIAVNPRIIVRRARFSSIIASDIFRAMNNPVPLDRRLADAVRARMELDLRIGAAITRWQTLRWQARYPILSKAIISYGSCQFPTLGFVVDRWNRRQRFITEKFWYLSLRVTCGAIHLQPTWLRGRLYHQRACTALLQHTLGARAALVREVRTTDAVKWRPLPLTTVELQKAGSRLLKISSDKVMKIAESLYIRGLISYPRTETDIFEPNFNLKDLIAKQTTSDRWGDFAKNLLDGAFEKPRRGKHNDQAHPPIHPTKAVDAGLSTDDAKVYEYITRRFLASCARNAKGSNMTAELSVISETFSLSGLRVLERNYLDVFPYDTWKSVELPALSPGVDLPIFSLTMEVGESTRPNVLTEAELITAMDKNGIGTDATIAEHIKKICDREYVIKSGMQFVPSQLGVGLVEGYDKVGAIQSLTKPTLRKQTEEQMSAIADGSKDRAQVVQEQLAIYHHIFQVAQQQVSQIEASLTQHLG